jgi:hypothetical protein
MTMPDIVVIEPHYLPSIEYFTCIQPYDNLQIEVEANYIKQTFRNRCYILGANNTLTLTIPVINGNSKTLMKDIQIDHSQRWLNEHWRSIQSAYGKAPYYEFFSDYFEKSFSQKKRFLLDFNLEMMTICLTLLKQRKNISKTEKFEKVLNNDILDARSLITPKETPAKRQIYKPFPYMQVFGKDFVANLSIIDLLMNEGPNAQTVVTNSIISE